MANQPDKPRKLASPQDPETVVEDGRAPEVEGETSPSADQSDRNDVLAARINSTPVKTLAMAKQEAKAKANKKTGKFINEDGEEEYVDPDELEEQAVVEEIPKDVCLNCQHHNRKSPLDSKGFCKKCGFKLNRVYNVSLEPGRKTL